ncbi:hypothetical protein PIB30_035084 [Stylosanthes scabra]|uniref:WRKY domain-containing protein n=1 Tax=Stylosanthes scabra TaxID=79078 RepID=A0ABU6QCF3_9FABA|nr:hypothetical protein [Stylosanthes scabra]
MDKSQSKDLHIQGFISDAIHQRGVCSTKKQVERCRTDASMLIITYTSTHNHPSPDEIFSTAYLSQKPKEQETEEATEEDLSKVKEQEHEHVE